mmetsp:Transcript_22360/g.62111  ORF Transcript_22360/g.62111 Transcript_22360/m.62111 type:complete len:96 (+) Transcript_22360:125-412(+)
MLPCCVGRQDETPTTHSSWYTLSHNQGVASAKVGMPVTGLLVGTTTAAAAASSVVCVELPRSVYATHGNVPNRMSSKLILFLEPRPRMAGEISIR